MKLPLTVQTSVSGGSWKDRGSHHQSIASAEAELGRMQTIYKLPVRGELPAKKREMRVRVIDSNGDVVVEPRLLQK